MPYDWQKEVGEEAWFFSNFTTILSTFILLITFTSNLETVYSHDEKVHATVACTKKVNAAVAFTFSLHCWGLFQAVLAPHHQALRAPQDGSCGFLYGWFGRVWPKVVNNLAKLNGSFACNFSIFGPSQFTFILAGNNAHPWLSCRRVDILKPIHTPQDPIGPFLALSLAI